MGAQVAGMEIWLGQQAYFHAGTSLSILFPGVKPSLIFTPTGDRGPLVHLIWKQKETKSLGPVKNNVVV